MGPRCVSTIAGVVSPGRADVKVAMVRKVARRLLAVRKMLAAIRRDACPRLGATDKLDKLAT